MRSEYEQIRGIRYIKYTAVSSGMHARRAHNIIVSFGILIRKVSRR